MFQLLNVYLTNSQMHSITNALTVHQDVQSVRELLLMNANPVIITSLKTDPLASCCVLQLNSKIRLLLFVIVVLVDAANVMILLIIVAHHAKQVISFMKVNA